jgi:hypothetical protein
MKSKYACLDENEIVFAITEFDVLSPDSPPIIAAYYAKIIDTIPETIPEIGQKWDGEKYI